MATESAMRLMEGSTAPTWPSSRDAIIFGSPVQSMGVDELRLLLKGHGDHAGQVDTIPNRSGSAPPSMEGSFAAIGNLLAQQDPRNSSLASLTSAFEKCETEEQLRSDPAYFAYYCSNVNLNPRLPPPLISRENRRLARHMGEFGNNWRTTSLDDTGSASLSFSGSSLPTHKEEPEDDRSPRHALTETRSASLNEQDTESLMGRHKSLVDLIQEDFPRTPSPVYQLRTSSITKPEEPLDQDVHPVSSSISSINISETADSRLDSTGVSNNTDAMDTHASSLASSSGSVDLSVSSSECTFPVGILPKPEIVNSNTKVSPLDDDSSFGASQSVISRGDIKIRKKQDSPQSYGRNLPQQYPATEQSSLHQPRVVQTQGNSRALNRINNLVERLNHGLPSPTEMQPSLHPSGLAPPLYATAAAYMTSGNAFYPNFQPPGLYAPQYSVGGYALGSTLLPPYMAGYPSPGAVHVPFPSTSGSGSSFNDQTAGVSTGETTPHPGDLQNLGRFYGQHGLMLQPFLDPFHMQHLQHPIANLYGPPVQHGRLSLPAVSSSPADSFAPNESALSAYMGDQKLQPQLNGSPGIQSPGKVIMTSGYYSCPTSMGIVTQFTKAPHTSPVLPPSPVGGTSHIDRRSELRFPQSPSRNAGLYSGWQGQRGYTSFDDSKRHSFLEELKTSNARRFELSDIAGRIVEFSVDQHGSRFIQQKLENCSVEDKDSVFKEVLPHASKLMIDVFGNYVIQKFFEHGSPEQRKELADQLFGQMLPLSLQMYGCRVIQKALEVVELDQKIQLVHELDGHVLRCVRDQNGNHVIQKCIECVSIERLGFIISAFRNQVATLSTHPYGCRVIQRVLEHCSDEPHSQCIVDEILDAACQLAQDQYGNYVTQHVLERGKPYERSHIIGKLKGKFVQMSQHKYASNVIEKCLEYGDTAEREHLIEEIIGQSDETDNLLVMMKDQFANYVVQKVLDVSNERQREIILSRVKVHLHALKKYTYGKHIAARFEQLFGEAAEGQSSEH